MATTGVQRNATLCDIAAETIPSIHTSLQRVGRQALTWQGQSKVFEQTSSNSHTLQR